MIRAGIAVALAGTLLLGGCKGKEAASETATTTDPVVTVRKENVAIVAPTELRSGPVISGSLQPEQQATVRAEVTET